MVGRPSWRSKSSWRPSRRCGTGQETIPEDRKGSETIPKVWKWSGDPPGGPELVGRSYRRSTSDWETLLEVQK